MDRGWTIREWMTGREWMSCRVLSVAAAVPAVSDATLQRGGGDGAGRGLLLRRGARPQRIRLHRGGLQMRREDARRRMVNSVVGGRSCLRGREIRGITRRKRLRRNPNAV